VVTVDKIFQKFKRPEAWNDHTAPRKSTLPLTHLRGWVQTRGALQADDCCRAVPFLLALTAVEPRWDTCTVRDKDPSPTLGFHITRNYFLPLLKNPRPKAPQISSHISEQQKTECLRKQKSEEILAKQQQHQQQQQAIAKYPKSS